MSGKVQARRGLRDLSRLPGQAEQGPAELFSMFLSRGYRAYFINPGGALTPVAGYTRLGLPFRPSVENGRAGAGTLPSNGLKRLFGHCQNRFR